MYGEAELAALKWKEAASIAFGFFQMAGFNRYHDAVGSSGTRPLLLLLLLLFILNEKKHTHTQAISSTSTS